MKSVYTNIESPIVYSDGAVSTPLPIDFNQQPIIRIRDAEGVVAAIQLASMHNILHIPYFPFTRSDHPPHSDLSAFIKSLDAQRRGTPLTIVTYDPHSEALSLLIEQSRNLELYVREQDLYNNISHFITKLPNLTKRQRPILVSTARYIEFFQKAGDFNKRFSGYIACPKFLHHPLPSQDPYGFLLKPDTHFVVVDDIADTGRTAVEIAKELKIPAERLSLYVSHGIFSEGTDELFEHYSTIATTNSFIQPEESPSKDLIFYALYDTEVSDSSSEEQEPKDTEETEGVPPQEEDVSNGE